MSKTDDARWTDLRSTQRAPFRAIGHCACGAEFYPWVRGQAKCASCCGAVATEEARAMREEQIPEPPRSAPSEQPLREEKHWPRLGRRSQASNYGRERYVPIAEGLARAQVLIDAGIPRKIVSQRVGIKVDLLPLPRQRL